MKLPPRLWLAELGKPETAWIYGVATDSIDMFNCGIGYRLKWDRKEKEVALYDSKQIGGPFIPV